MGLSQSNRDMLQGLQLMHLTRAVDSCPFPLQLLATPYNGVRGLATRLIKGKIGMSAICNKLCIATIHDQQLYQFHYRLSELLKDSYNFAKAFRDGHPLQRSRSSVEARGQKLPGGSQLCRGLRLLHLIS